MPARHDRNRSARTQRFLGDLTAFLLLAETALRGASMWLALGIFPDTLSGCSKDRRIRLHLQGGVHRTLTE